MELNKEQQKAIAILNQVSDKTLSQAAAVKQLVALGSASGPAQEMVHIAAGGSDLIMIDEETGKRIVERERT